MDTKLGHVSQTPVTTGVPAAWAGHQRFVGKHEQRLGHTVGLTQFGVNLVTLEPGSQSSLRHWHEAEDEFIYVLEGELTLVDDNGEHQDRSSGFRPAPPTRTT